MFYKKEGNGSKKYDMKSVGMSATVITALVTVLILSVVTSAISYNTAWSKSDKDKDYCYDQVGDCHPCFDTKKECRHEKKHDEIAESPCYNKDVAY